MSRALSCIVVIYTEHTYWSKHKLQKTFQQWDQRIFCIYDARREFVLIGKPEWHCDGERKINFGAIRLDTISELDKQLDSNWCPSH